MDPRTNPSHTPGGHEQKKPPKSEPSGFAAFGLRPELLQAVDRLGWTLPTPIQHEAIPHALAGHDLIGLAQTGTGKTGAFVLPLLAALSTLPQAQPLHPYCIILAPTRELVQQIDTEIKALGRDLKLRSMTIFGGVSDRPQISLLSAGVEIITATPGRLLDLIGQRWVHFEKVTHCVLDEADRMFDMGFILDLKRIMNRMPVRKQTMLFSATMPPEIQHLAQEFLYQPREVRMGTATPPPELSHEVWELDATQKNDALDALLREDFDSVLVFTRTKHRADSVARRLSRGGETVAVLHSNRSQNQRDQALASFKQGQVRVLVATDVASRGLDVIGIGLVVNFDPPHDPGDYVHRVGRTARAKRPGRAVTLLAQDELQYVRKIEQLLKQRLPRRQQSPQPQPQQPLPASVSSKYGYYEEPERKPSANRGGGNEASGNARPLSSEQGAPAVAGPKKPRRRRRRQSAGDQQRFPAR